ncbi:LysR family transcriptional regulator [Dyella tabacisoli]|uniref:LysR family transcriptional regulator n=1 Tax=Dyella tabacisoli TaxID=2282381 RepID=A0A369UMB2_9GAMM|nr:LysR family transcriptional regulator [Dyella tabacisoli]RDD81483.1 LysR family transcriptional regulator [Dyella tabacisoli]
MKSGEWSLDDLQLVRAIAANGNLAGAARDLGIDHSNAFRRLGTVEQRLGVKLFRRSRRGYQATEEGELAAQAAERVLAETDLLSRQLLGRDRHVHGRLRVTAPDTLVGHLAELCAEFTALHPMVHFDLVINNAFLTLQQRDADVAIRPAQLSPQGLSVRKLASVATAVYAPKPARRKEPAERWIGLGDALSHLAAAQWLRNHVDPARIALTVDTLPAALAACEAGLGRALLPCFYADRSRAVSRLGAPLPEVQTQLWFVTHPDLRSSARIRLFRDFVVQWIAHRDVAFSAGL